MSSRIVNAELQRTQRELRARIGRLRRRIDGRVHAAGGEVRRLASWRTYVRRWPGNAVLAAFGSGLALAAGLSARRWSRWLGLRLLRGGVDRALRRVGEELQRVWANSSPASKPAETDGGDHG